MPEGRQDVLQGLERSRGPAVSATAPGWRCGQRDPRPLVQRGNERSSGSRLRRLSPFPSGKLIADSLEVGAAATRRGLSVLNSVFTCFVASVIGATGMPAPSVRPTTRVTLPGGLQVDSLYDTGACVTMIDEKEFRNIPINKRPQKNVYAPWLTLEGADKKMMQVKGCYAMPITLLDRKITHFFYVVKNLSSPVILGIDFINQHALTYNPALLEVSFMSAILYCFWYLRLA